MHECIDRYGALIWSLARRLSRTPADAEDATQEIYLQIWQQAARYDDSLGSEKTFIAMIARRRLIDRLRKTAAEPLVDSSSEMLESVAWSGMDPGTATETFSEVERALRALAELRSEVRQVLELGILDGLAHAEIAKRLDVPLGTVKSNMRRGLLRVRECINRNDGKGVEHAPAICDDKIERPRPVAASFPRRVGVFGLA